MQSQYINKLSDLSDFYDADIQLLLAFVDDALNPSICVLKLKSGLMSLVKDVLDFQYKNGKTEKSNERITFLEGLISHLESIEKISNRNIHYQLAMKENYRQMEVLKARNKELELIIENYNNEI